MAWQKLGKIAAVAMLVVLLPACGRSIDASWSRDVVTRHIMAAMPPGWRVSEQGLGDVPYGVDVKAADRVASQRLELVGPTPVEISGYYCEHGAFCPRPIAAREALELWILPAAVAATAGEGSLAGRSASLLVVRHGWAIYALVSRHAPGLDFDAGFTGASTETSKLQPGTGDLPISWHDWHEDLLARLS